MVEGPNNNRLIYEHVAMVPLTLALHFFFFLFLFSVQKYAFTSAILLLHPYYPVRLCSCMLHVTETVLIFKSHFNRQIIWKRELSA